MLRRVFLVLVVAGALLAALVYSQHREPVFHVSGFIEADEIRVGSRVGGRVARTLVREGERITRGQPLIELEPYDLIERQAQARAQLAERSAQHDRLKAGPRRQEVAAADARLALAVAQQKIAAQTLDRIRGNFERNAASQDELNEASDQLDSANATLIVRQQELDQLREGTRPEEIAEARAAVDAAAAAVAVIDKQIAELKVVSPVDGIVEALELQPGDLVAANAPVLSLLDTSRLWVRAYVPENRLDIQNGDKVSITVDSYPDRKFAGHVSFIARQAEFTPSNVQTPEERSKQVFRIKATLDEGLSELRPGMSADVWPNK